MVVQRRAVGLAAGRGTGNRAASQGSVASVNAADGAVIVLAKT
jgi:hypothetical protein